MRVPVLGEAVTHLPWLSPSADALVALARAPAESWSAVRGDPACALLIVRGATRASSPANFAPAILCDAGILTTALRLWDKPAGIDWSLPQSSPILDACLHYAEFARRIAQRTGRVDPEFAWIGGLLAPLGWLAIVAEAPAEASACLNDPVHAEQPCITQTQRWGLDQAALARRLARRWQLPDWLSAIVGHLALPADTAISLNAEPNIFRVAQLAISLAQKRKPLLSLDVGSRSSDLAAALGLSPDDLERIATEPLPVRPTRTWASASSMPLLRDLLSVAEENRRLAEAPVLGQIEVQLDELHRALAHQRTSEGNRLQSQKLNTLAEFAAGAGHEINNPLAVISGQAQYLLGREGEPDRQKSLQKIIAQAQRIHEILNLLMQFARPPKPQKRLIDLGGLIREAALELSDFAQRRQVRLVCAEPEPPISLHVDPRQVRTALMCLMRNAIEAAPAEGWAGVRATMPAPDLLELLVEDSGSGPAADQREHLFDPFYSGRQAGRGRGLGLPTAWRLSREHGGDVFLADRADGPTCFVLRLPLDLPWNATHLNGESGVNGNSGQSGSSLLNS